MNSMLNNCKINNSMRVDWVDIYKGIGIVLMVLGHSGFQGYFDQLIHAFHMPMFFFVSGFMFDVIRCHNTSVVSYILRKIRTLIIPYCFFGLLSFMLWTLLKGFKIENLRILFFDNTKGIAISGALWFLTALFIADFIFYFIEKHVSGHVSKIIMVFILSSFGCMVKKFLLFELPFAIGPALVGLGFMMIAKNLNHFNQKIRNMNYLVVFPIAAVAVILAFMNSPINMRTGTYGNLFIFWIDALLWIFLLIKVAMSIENSTCCIVKYLKLVGLNSITYVCLNQLCLYGIGFFLKMFGIHGVDSHLVLFVGCMILIHFMNYIFIKSHLMCIFGKVMQSK